MLRGNYSTLTRMAGRTLSGGVAAFRPMQNGTARRNRYLAFSQLASEPSGYRPPATRSLAIKPGAVSSYGRAAGTSALTATASRGRNAEATITGSSTFTATAVLVVPAVATIAGTSTVTGNANAPVAAMATLTGTGAMTGTTRAVGHAAATLAGVAGSTATPSAVGHCEADITPYAELSPQSLAESVWGHNTAAIIEATLRNRTVTDPDAGTITVYDANDQPLLVADLWQDADGTIAYAGAGAERRDRLVSP